MEKEKMIKLKYVTPTVRVMQFEPGRLLAGSAVSGGKSASSGGWNVDDDGTGTTGSTGAASTGSWSTN